jgi:hypothetical protein
MLRKIIVVGAASAAVAGLGLVNTPTADAYAYWRNGYFYGDTSYRGNVPGSYAKLIGRRDTARQIYYITMTLCDQRTDGNRAAARIRAYDMDTRQWVAYATLHMISGIKGCDRGYFSFSTARADRIIVQDGIYGKTYGSNFVMIFRRKYDGQRRGGASWRNATREQRAGVPGHRCEPASNGSCEGGLGLEGQRGASLDEVRPQSVETATVLPSIWPCTRWPEPPKSCSFGVPRIALTLPWASIRDRVGLMSSRP